jgi:transcriptional regulator with GAF, ATPase, and Fis domain
LVSPPPLLYTDPKSGELRRRSWRLVVTDGADQGQIVEINQSPALIGAAPAAALVLSDDTVSRYHLEIDVFAEGMRLRDLDSTNGTFVGNQRIRDAFLEPGELFRVGRTTIRAEIREEPAAPEIDTDPLGLPLGAVERLGDALAVSVAMRALFEDLRKVARSPSTVLLEGEPGVGKATAARLLHELSPRRARVMIQAEIPAQIDPQQADELLFGAGEEPDKPHRPGVFEQANGSTLFIEAVERLPPMSQRRLLRAIESGEVQRPGEQRRRRVDVRLIASAVDAAQVDRKLARRLAVVRLLVPPLRDRTDDLLPLARHFLERSGVDTVIGPRLKIRLEHDPWPGNLDELAREVVSLTDPPSWIPITARTAERSSELRRAWIADRLGAVRGNVTRAAADLGVPSRALFRFLARHNVDLEAM